MTVWQIALSAYACGWAVDVPVIFHMDTVVEPTAPRSWGTLAVAMVVALTWPLTCAIHWAEAVHHIARNTR